MYKYSEERKWWLVIEIANLLLNEKYLEVSASFFSAKVTLVGAVAAVVLAVALPGGGDAATVAAPELAGLAGHVQAAVFIWKDHARVI